MPRRFLPPIFPQGVPPGDYLDATTTLTQGVSLRILSLSCCSMLIKSSRFGVDRKGSIERGTGSTFPYRTEESLR